jgi:beta-lactamase superfamily II metal-dependent hydrolase
MSEITKYEIDMLDVKAADAFLIHMYVKFEQCESEYVVLIDAGNESDGETILNHINKYYSQKYIDLAICTHCDSDHYGGFKRLIEEQKKKGDFTIKKIWIHDPYTHIDVDDVKYVRKKQTLKQRLNDAYMFSDGTNLIEALDDAEIKRYEPFTGLEDTVMNIRVLGPDKDYYESLIPDFRVDLDFKEEQSDDVYSGALIQYEDDFFSKALEKAYDDKSKVNQSSVVFLFTAKGKHYLFTGDAGKEALHRIVDADTDELCKNITFLKVPHHGSKHNLDNDLIKYFNPETSFISTEKYGKYVNKCIVNALKKCGNVYSTHKDRSSLWHHNGTDIRSNYSTAQPL